MNNPYLYAQIRAHNWIPSNETTPDARSNELVASVERAPLACQPACPQRFALPCD